MSLRVRLLLATAVVALVALVGADVATFELLQSSLYQQVDSSLEQSHQVVEGSIGPEEGAPAPVRLGHGSPCPSLEGHPVTAEGLTPGTVIEVRDRAGRTAYRCATTELGEHNELYPVLPTRLTGFSGHRSDPDDRITSFTAEAPNGDEFRVWASILGGGPEKGGELIIAVPLTRTLDILGTLRTLEIVVTGIAVVVVLGLGFWLVRAGLHPLREVERTADAIAGGQLTERVAGDEARTEVGQVARALNVMLERIEGAFAQRDRTEADLRASEERMRQFVADASHELRTPLAAVTAYAELFDRGAAERPEDLARLLQGIEREAARMGHLVEDLLVLARLDQGRPLVREPFDLAEVAADAVEMARMVGPEWPVELEADGAGEEVGPVVVEADGLRIRQVLDNLLANVRVHTPPGTHATVRVARDGDDAVIEVADDGPGLSAADARRIFERFFRADPSRSRAHGGAGLGLAIVQSIVHAHGGTVTLGAAPSAGARFVVRLPEHSRPQAMGAVAAAPDALAGTDDRAAGIEEGTAVTARTDAEVSTGEAPTADDGADAADAATAGDGKAAGNGVPSSRRSWGFPHRRP